MALTRKLLKGMQLTDEQVDTIIEAHSETVNALKEERDTYKADAEKLPEVQKKLEIAQAQIERNGGEETVLKSDFDKMQKEYEDYKANIEAEKAHAAKENAYRELLKTAGIGEKRIDAIVKVTKIDEIELNKDGKIKDAEQRTENIKTEWADFIETTTTKGAKTSTPLTSNGSAKLTKAEIYKRDDHGRYVLSTSERQKALAENPELLN